MKFLQILINQFQIDIEEELRYMTEAKNKAEKKRHV